MCGRRYAQSVSLKRSAGRPPPTSTRRRQTKYAPCNWPTTAATDCFGNSVAPTAHTSPESWVWRPVRRWNLLGRAAPKLTLPEPFYLAAPAHVPAVPGLTGSRWKPGSGDHPRCFGLRSRWPVSPLLSSDAHPEIGARHDGRRGAGHGLPRRADHARATVRLKGWCCNPTNGSRFREVRSNLCGTFGADGLRRPPSTDHGGGSSRDRRNREWKEEIHVVTAGAGWR